jgi:hypothetical protein
MVAILLVAAAVADEGGPACEPVVAEGSAWTDSRLSMVPDEPWCLQMATPGKGELDVDLWHNGGPVARWSLEVRAENGTLLKEMNLDDPDPREARLRTRVPIGPESDHVVVTVVGAGHALDLTVSFRPIPPTITALLLPDGSPAVSVVRGQTLVLTGQDFADDPRTRVLAGNVLMPPDRIEADRLTFRVPARAHDSSLLVDGPSGGSNRLTLPLADPDPGPPFGIPLLPAEGKVAVDIFADPHWSADELSRQVDAALAGCSLSTDWMVQGYSLTISLYTMHLEVPAGQTADAYGDAVVRCLAKGLDLGVGGLVVGEKRE